MYCTEEDENSCDSAMEDGGDAYLYALQHNAKDLSARVAYSALAAVYSARLQRRIAPPNARKALATQPLALVCLLLAFCSL